MGLYESKRLVITIYKSDMFSNKSDILKNHKKMDVFDIIKELKQ